MSDNNSQFIPSDIALYIQQQITASTEPLVHQDALLKMFKPVNSVKSARDKLHNLRQVSSVLKHNYEFRQLLIEINDMGAADQLDYYVRGLKRQVRLQVELHQPTTLQQAMLFKKHRMIVWYIRSYLASRISIYSEFKLCPVMRDEPIHCNKSKVTPPLAIVKNGYLSFTARGNLFVSARYHVSI